ncbi:hypothetical protein FS749_008945 [Ceratobasidium sp. UAMH 11750]|nr:hypothetical protein FS749_008945 [Ceratobasidium sp. UAMH 11750]
MRPFDRAQPLRPEDTIQSETTVKPHSLVERRANPAPRFEVYVSPRTQDLLDEAAVKAMPDLQVVHEEEEMGLAIKGAKKQKRTRRGKRAGWQVRSRHRL